MVNWKGGINGAAEGAATGASFGGGWGALAGGVIGGAMGLFGSKSDSAAEAAARQYNYQRLLNQQAYDLTQQGYRESPSNQRAGLEAAGYNPILALGGGGMSYGSYSGGSASAPQDSTTSEMGNMATNAYQVFKLARDKNKADIAGIVAGIKNSNADAALKAEQAITEQSKRTQMDFQNAMMDVQTHLARKDLDWYDRKNYAQIYEMMQRAENYQAIAAIKRYDAQTNRMNAQTNSINVNLSSERWNADKTKAERYSKWHKDHPYQTDWQYGLSNWRNATGISAPKLYGYHHKYDY